MISSHQQRHVPAPLTRLPWLNRAGLYAVRLSQVMLCGVHEPRFLWLDGEARDPQTPSADSYRFATAVSLPQPGQSMRGRLYDLCWFASIQQPRRSPFREDDGCIVLPDPEYSVIPGSKPGTYITRAYFPQLCYTLRHRLVFHFLLDRPQLIDDARAQLWTPVMHHLHGVVSEGGLSAFDFARGNIQNTHRHQQDFLRKLRQSGYTDPQRVPLVR